MIFFPFFSPILSTVFIRWYHFLFNPCNGNGILETQKIHVALLSRCWQPRAWLGRAGSLQDQREAEVHLSITALLRNDHAVLKVLATSCVAGRSRTGVAPELVRNAECQAQPRAAF